MSLAWFDRLNRMMAEVPDRYLEPRVFDVSLVPGSKLVGQLTEEEKRLLGVFYQISEKINLEGEAHQALHAMGDHTINEGCLSYNIRQQIQEDELMLVGHMLFRSVAERLSMPESDFIFDSYDIYAIEMVEITDIKNSYRGYPEQIMSFPIDPSKKPN